jgi:SAM-dependent methyltransferase
MESSYTPALQEMFPNLDPEVNDLFLLEAHQVASLLERAPLRALAGVLHAHPRLHRFLVARYPPIEQSLQALTAAYEPAPSEAVPAFEQAVAWELADWIAYQRAPGAYDASANVDWDLAAVTEIVRLDDKVIIDAGAGTGRVALSVAPRARHVFAIEPVATLRDYLREKAALAGIDNLFVMDGFLHSIPLPEKSADILLTCQAIGWDLPAELAEIERVVAPGGIAMHLFGAPDAVSPEDPLTKGLVADGYRPETYQDGPLVVDRYWKQLGAGNHP